MSIRIFNGQWLLAGEGVATNDDCCCADDLPPCTGDGDCLEGQYCCDGVCQGDPCDAGACCDEDGSCSQTSEGDCSGTWHAGVACEDIDCTSGCCETVTSPNGNCSYQRCVRGEKEDCSPCDPAEPQPQEPVPDCEGGSPSTVTVSGSGFVANSGTQPLDDDLNRIMNDSYVLDVECNGGATGVFYDGNYVITVFAGISYVRVASIGVLSFGTLLAQMNLVGPAETPTTTDCGAGVYQCDGYSGAPTSTSGAFGDFSGASIDVSV